MKVIKQEIIFAKEAKSALETIKGNHKYLDEKFIHVLNGLPAFISQNGLLQALTFYKDKEPKLYSSLACFLGDCDIINALTRATDINAYVMLQKRAIDFAAWLKQLANALYKKPASNN